MYKKWKLCGIILLSCICVCLHGTSASAEEGVPDGLPEIIRWECGGGYDRDGNRITGAWAYDTTGQAGKYVLFDGDGMVQKKADRWEDRDNAEEYYTFTENKEGSIALRAEVFSGFDGEIAVTVESENGVSREFVLSRENLYEWNVPSPEGAYRIREVKAMDERSVYAAEYPEEPLLLEEKGLVLACIKVDGRKTETIQQDDEETMAEGQPDREETTAEIQLDGKEMTAETQADGKIKTADSSEEENGREEEALYEKIDISKNTTGKGGRGKMHMDIRKILFGGIVLALAAGLVIRGRKKRYQ
jgi:hypothetical protein